MRIRQDEINDSIYRPLGGETEVKSSIDDCILSYTIEGQQDEMFDGFPISYDEDSDKVCAREVTLNGKKSYWVRIGMHGKFHNPLTSDKKFRRKNEIEKQLGDKFIEINEQAFKLYRKFLVTKNTRYLQHAEREVI